MVLSVSQLFTYISLHILNVIYLERPQSIQVHVNVAKLEVVVSQYRVTVDRNLHTRKLVTTQGGHADIASHDMASS